MFNKGYTMTMKKQPGNISNLNRDVSQDWLFFFRHSEPPCLPSLVSKHPVSKSIPKAHPHKNQYPKQQMLHPPV